MKSECHKHPGGIMNGCMPCEVTRLNMKLKEIKQAFVEYQRSEGSSCCSDYPKHSEDANRMGRLLGFKKFDDDSGYDFTN